MAAKGVLAERTTHAQVRQMRACWEALMQLQPRLLAAMPTVMGQAREKLTRHNPGGTPEFAHVVLFAFYRLATHFTQHAEALTMREVSEMLEIPLSSATRLVDTLVENGFVERLPDPQDRRVVRITLTPTGRMLHETAVEFFDDRLAEFLEHFDARERAELLALFDKTVRVLRELNP